MLVVISTTKCGKKNNVILSKFYITHNIPGVLQN